MTFVIEEPSIIRTGKAMLHGPQLRYRIEGKTGKPWLTFLNSLGTDMTMWDAQIPFLSRYFQILRLDTIGHGLSDIPQTPISLADLGNSVVQLWDFLNIDQSALCGISMGGITALWMTIHHSDRVTKTIAANTAAKIGQEQAWLDRARAVRNAGMAELAHSAASRWFTQEFTQLNQRETERLSWQLATTNPTGYAACCEALATASVLDELGKIRRPVCVIAGEKDPVTTLADAEKLRKCIRGSQLKTLPASHLSNVECPTEFNIVVKDFLTSHP